MVQWIYVEDKTLLLRQHLRDREGEWAKWPDLADIKGSREFALKIMKRTPGKWKKIEHKIISVVDTNRQVQDKASGDRFESAGIQAEIIFKKLWIIRF